MELNKLRHERTKIVTEGNLQSENIDCFYSPVRISFNDNERSYIDKKWNYEVKKKSSIFDGKLFHVKRQEFLLPRLVFDTCMSSFKEWIGTKRNEFKKLFGQKRNEFKKLFGQKRIIKPLSVGSMIVTSDNKWIIGRRLETYNFEGQYTLLAGYMDPDRDIINFKPDPFFAIKREIVEETGIDKNRHISNITCLGLDCTDQPYLAFSTQLGISYDELISNMPEEKEFRISRPISMKSNLLKIS